MTRRIGLIGVPSSAGAHWPGQDKAPHALRAAGLVERLAAMALGVTDYGDLPQVRMRPDRGPDRAQNLAAVLDVATAVAERVEAAIRCDEIPLVLGGDCTIELGVLSGFLRAGRDPALLYFDGGVDLYTPATNPTGILDSMGVAHMIAEPGAEERLARIGPRYPLMQDDRIVFFGYGPNRGDIEGVERGIITRRAMAHYPCERVRGRPTEAAAEALQDIERRGARFVVHFDVDVMDFVDFPVADVPQIRAGLTFREAMVCLGVFAASRRLGALVITEFNPDHADEGGTDAGAFVEGIVNAVAGNAM